MRSMGHGAWGLAVVLRRGGNQQPQVLPLLTIGLMVETQCPVPCMHEAPKHHQAGGYGSGGYLWCCRSVVAFLAGSWGTAANRGIPFNGRGWGVGGGVNQSELSEGVGGAFGRLNLFNTATDQELLDCDQSKAHDFQKEWE